MGPLPGADPLAHPKSPNRMAKKKRVDEGRKRVLAIVARILVAGYLKTTEDLFDTKPSPRTETRAASAVQWAERIMNKIHGVYP